MEAKHPPVPPEAIAVFQAYSDQINSERETLWARHNALLLANSLIIGAVAISPAPLWQSKWVAVGMLSVGFLISVAWFGIAVQGWASLRHHAELAGAFTSRRFRDLPNPLVEIVCNPVQRTLHRLVLLVIAIFMLMYLGLGSMRFFAA